MRAAAATPWRKSEDKVIAGMRLVANTARRIDGADWYEAAAVCRAIGMDARYAYPHVPRAHKRCIWVDRGRYRQARMLLMDRRGIEILVILRGGLCRGRVMDALDALMQGRCDEKC